MFTLFLLKVLVPMTIGFLLFWVVDQLFLKWYEKKPNNTFIKSIYKILPILVIVTIAALFRLRKYQLDFDFNWILVPITLLFFVIAVLDKLIFKERKSKGKGNEAPLIAWAYDFWPVLGLVLVVRSFLFEPYNIPSSSMRPSLLTGDFILVNKFAYGVRLPLTHTKILNTGTPERGDVAVFRYPEKPSIYYIKRIIGVPGDTITYQNGKLHINGKALKTEKNTTFRYDKPRDNAELTFATIFNETINGKTHLIRDLNGVSSEQSADFLQSQNPHTLPMNLVQQWTVTVPKGNYFTMGDNRDRSADSRFWGFVPENNLSGKATHVWMHKEPGLKIPSFSTARKIQ